MVRLRERVAVQLGPQSMMLASSSSLHDVGEGLGISLIFAAVSGLFMQILQPGAALQLFLSALHVCAAFVAYI